MKEVWKDIIGYEGIYQVSNIGNVKSLTRFTKATKIKSRLIKGHVVSQSFDGRGYLFVKLYREGIQKSIKVHVLVAVAFLGHIQNGKIDIVVDHISNIKTDNCAWDLQLISQRENSSKDRKNCTSSYVGVSWYRALSKWRAQILINRKFKHLGYFKKEIDASEAYKKALKEHININ